MARCPAHGSLPHLKREITIAGGGLAGLSLAVGLRQAGVPVQVLEAGHYPRHRVCGEFISGVSEATLSALGILDLFADAKMHRSLEWYETGKLLHRDNFKHPAYGISRHLLDARLWQRVLANGGTVTTGFRAQPEAQEGHLWAAGRRPQNGTWIGLKAHVRHPKGNADLEMHAGRNGYAGLAGVEDGWTNVCGLFKLDRTLKAGGKDLLPTYLAAGGNEILAAALRSTEWREGSFSAVAGFQLGRQHPLPGILTLGDAESMIPPFTGNGMSMAFQAAECALAPLSAWSEGEISWQAACNIVRKALRRRFQRRLAMAGLMHHFVLEQSGRSLLQSMASAHLLPFQPMLALIR